MSDLTNKQEMFCKEYLIDLNATQSAIRAGYSENTAYSIGHENLSKPEIQNRLSELMEKRSKRTEITADRVLEELSRLAFFDIRKLYDNNGQLKKLADLDDDTAKALTSVKALQSMETEYKMADKKGALELLGKHLKLFTDRVETIDMTPTVIKDDIDDCELEE